MSYKVGYEDVLTLPTYSEYSLITADLSPFTDHDYCVTVNITPDIEGTCSKKKEEEAQTGCVWGRPGQHMGLFVDFNFKRFVFAWFEEVDGETVYKNIISEEGKVTQEPTTISILKNSGEKTFKMFINGEIETTGFYGDLKSYTGTPIYLGVGNLDENAFPYNDKLQATYHNFSINNTHMYNTKLDGSTLVYLDFEEENTTYYSIYDISKNGNRARINHHKYDYK